MKNLLNTAVDSARKWDPTREPAIGGAQRGNIDKLGKNAIAFYNGDGASRDEFQNPGVPNLVSEYGSTTADRPGPFIAGWRDLNQTPGYEDPFNPPAWRSGQIIWCGFDHGTIFGKGMATMGMVDYFRIPKKQYYWYVERLVKGVKSPVEPQWPVSGIPFGLKIETSDIVISSTDGTDDIWMQIGVIDESGQYINNNVNIELSVISGPGEFPTGRKIKFTPPSDDDASDIAIRDGKAAITFRSYHGGKSLIKATSDGLKPAIIEITTKGLPMWIEGQSKPVPDRPYKRFEDDIVGYNSNPDEMLLATNRPTWSSSALEGTNKANVNDGDINTLWKPNIDDKDKWWKLALEASYNISRINISLPKDEVCYIYKIERSEERRVGKEC